MWPNSLETADLVTFTGVQMSKRDSLSSPETCNIASTVKKTNIKNVSDNQIDTKKMILIRQFKK